MTKGTQSFGKRLNKTHTLCRRCGKVSYHIQKSTCSSCSYPAAGMRKYEWGQKAKRRRSEGTGRMSYLKTIARRLKNGFRYGAHLPSMCVCVREREEMGGAFLLVCIALPPPPPLPPLS